MGKKHVLDMNRTYHSRDGKVTGARVQPCAGSNMYCYQIVPGSASSDMYDHALYTKHGFYFSSGTDYRDLIADPIVTHVKSKPLKVSDIHAGDYVTVRVKVDYVTFDDKIAIEDDLFHITDIISHEKAEFKIGDTATVFGTSVKILFITEDKKTALVEYSSGFCAGTRESRDYVSLSR